MQGQDVEIFCLRRGGKEKMETLEKNPLLNYARPWGVGSRSGTKGRETGISGGYHSFSHERCLDRWATGGDT